MTFPANRIRPTRNCVVVTGASGQDGLIAAELLSRRGWSVYAVVRQSSQIKHYEHLVPKAFWMPFADILQLPDYFPDGSKLHAIIHLASNSSVPDSWLDPVKTMLDSTRALHPVLRLAERFDSPLIMAGSSQIYSPSEVPVSTRTAAIPQSPYGAAKLAAQHLLGILREGGRVRGSNVTLFNHDSPLRAPAALMPQLSNEFLRFIRGASSRILVPNPQVRRDFSWAPDFVKVICNPELWESNRDIMLGSGIATEISSLVQTAASTLRVGEEDIEYFATEVDPKPTIAGEKDAGMTFGLRQTVESEFVLAKIIEMHLRESNQGRSQVDIKRAVLLRLVDEM